MDLVKLLDEVSVYLGTDELHDTHTSSYNIHITYNTLHDNHLGIDDYYFTWVGCYIMDYVNQVPVACVSRSYYKDQIYCIHDMYVYMLCDLYKESVRNWLDTYFKTYYG
jgi:hypothetical protein